VFILVVISGEFRGRYVGVNLLGLRKIPPHTGCPEIPVPGTEYSLFVHLEGAAHLLPARAIEVQGVLKAAGIERAPINA
jgi:hypothetical protein